MAARREPPTLTRLLASRIVAVSAVAFMALVVFIVGKYSADTPALRLATLNSDLQEVIEMLEHGDDPATQHRYLREPAAYAFRILTRRAAERGVIAAANAHLLPDPDGLAWANGAGPALERSFDQVGAAVAGNPAGSLWLLTEQATLRGQPVWVQIAMLGDPDRRWAMVLGQEVVDHVVVPAAIIVPPLALVLLLALRRALRPLLRITEQAEALGAAAAAGRPMLPLDVPPSPAEYRRVVMALNAMLARLETALIQQRQFAADAAHQLRTPLSVLTLELERWPAGPARTRLAAEVDDLSRLVGQLLRLAQAEAAIAAEQQPLDLVPIARHACEMLAVGALARGQSIEFDAPDRPVLIRGQPSLIEVAISNLIDNALRHGPRDAIVSVIVDPGRRVLVEDAGAGVSDADKQRIFDRFVRIERKPPAGRDDTQGGRDDTPGAEGSGIGLALVRRIAQIHGGIVHVQDRPGGGARFVLDFAAQPEVVAAS